MIASILACVMHEAARQSGETGTWLEVVASHVAGLRYGVIQIVIHDSRVVQIERTEKVRLNHSAADSAAQASDS